ncbi:MAG: FtsX-like permease family protein [Clostridiales bacterium]|nr:FtsX-like permease family protein [Clostridiales bacterium]
MNIMNKLTLRQLKLNKRRTLVTIIGVIISVAMVMAVATLTVSFMDLMRRQTISRGGEWHVLYKNINKDQLKAVRHDKLTKALAITRDRGYAYLDGGQNEYKPYLFIKEYDAQGFKQLPVELSEGRLPEADYEVVISEHISTNGMVEYKIGDVLYLDIGDRVFEDWTDGLGQQNPFQRGEEEDEFLEIKEKKRYNIVGIIKRPDWEPTSAPGYTIISYMDESLVGSEDYFNASVIFNKVNRSIYKNVEKFAGKNNIDTFSFNNELLRYYGIMMDDNMHQVLYSLSAIIILIIMAGSISLIYNAFAISVSERSRYLGMLAGAGATKKQKRNGVLFEGAVIGLVSIPVGIISGMLGMYITFAYANSLIQGAFGLTENLRLVVTPLSLLTTCLVSMATILISAYIPAKRASRISAVDAMRQTVDVKLTQKTVKTSKLVRFTFGVEADIALKNLKRNKKRYRATVFALIISIILFLTVSFFTESIRKAAQIARAETNYDISVYGNYDAPQMDGNTIKSVVSLPGVTEYSQVSESHSYAWIDQESLSDYLKPDYGLFKDGKFLIGIHFHALDEKSLVEYAKEVGVDYEILKDSSDLPAILIDTSNFFDEDSRKYVETKVAKIKAGQKIKLIDYDWEDDTETDLNNIKIVGLTARSPKIVHPGDIGSWNVVISEKTMEKLSEGDSPLRFSSNLHLISEDPIKTQEEIENMKIEDVFIQNDYRYRQSEEQTLLLLSIFIYGFIILITAVSIANIFNTISTSVLLRKREFAMLKSVGMTPKSFNRMVNYESIFYGMKSLFYGLPISVAIMYLIYNVMADAFVYNFTLPWKDILIVIIAIFVVVSSTMLYSGGKIKRENIMDGLRQESV